MLVRQLLRWWNWQTRSTQNAVPTGVWVRIPPGARGTSLGFQCSDQCWALTIGRHVRFAGRAGKPERRLRQVRKELARLHDALQVYDEQLRYVAGVADDASTRALVSANPSDRREGRAAKDDAARARRQRDETARKIEALEAEQDRLLERMLD